MGDAPTSTKHGRTRRIVLLVTTVACAMALGCLALGGCQQAAPTSGGDQKASDPASKAQAAEPADQKADAGAKADTKSDAAAGLPGTFTNVDAGAWGDTQYARAVNAGNRA